MNMLIKSINLPVFEGIRMAVSVSSDTQISPAGSKLERGLSNKKECDILIIVNVIFVR